MSRNDHDEHDASSPFSVVPRKVPDPVETRDGAVRAVPRQSGRAWLYVIPAAILVVIGIGWMLATERARPGGAAPYAVTGTSGAKLNDPEGGPRGDQPLNPHPAGPAVVSDMGLLRSKQDMVGRAVRMTVPVQSVAGPHTFWVGRFTDRTLVYAPQPYPAGKNAGSGEVVYITGQLEHAPEDAHMPQGTSTEDRKALSGEDVIIRADHVELAPRGIGGTQAPTPEANRSTRPAGQH